MDVIFATETQLRVFFFTSGCPSSGSVLLVLLKRNRVPEENLIFSECRLITMDLFSCGKTVRLVAVYASTTTGKSEYVRDLDKFLVTSHILVLIGDYITQSAMYAWIMLAHVLKGKVILTSRIC